MLSPEQVRAARGLVALSQTALAEAAGVSLPTVKRLETRGTGRSAVDTVLSIQRALEAAGVQFLAPGDAAAGPGVALRTDAAGGH